MTEQGLHYTAFLSHFQVLISMEKIFYFQTTAPIVF